MDKTRFVELALANDMNRVILERLPSLGLADAWIVSGSLFQSVWNGLIGRMPDYGIKDYDIFYFDPDTSFEAEDAVIRRAAASFGEMAGKIEIRNQARVHLWYPQKFGTAYPALASSKEGIDRFLAICSMVGMRFHDGDYEIYAPYGFDDLKDMIIRPNPVANFRSALYEEKARRWLEKWPQARLIPAAGR